MNEIFAIVDSGSTKSDWVLLNAEKQIILKTQSIGLNPLFIQAEAIQSALAQNAELSALATQVAQINFYGAGTRTESLKNEIKNGISAIFCNAKIEVESDLKAACLAAYHGKPCLVAILGTGSNACFFDGKNIFQETPSLGFILGDEGSGNHIGRALIRDYFSQKMPLNIAENFQQKYNLNKDKLLLKVYQSAHPNTFLASFNEFAYQYRHEAYIQHLVEKCLTDFVEYQILPYEQKYNCEINFIGSIAHTHRKILEQVCYKFHLKLGEIIQKPIDYLVEKHIKNQ
uniref:BadF/BadG/BcrA/BcrD ATPase family protein n=1 Tax=Ornithobacterium rhinotracheale TaxID=28251 RepID=UPI0039A739C6